MGKWSNLTNIFQTNIFQTGWNHQLAKISWVLWLKRLAGLPPVERHTPRPSMHWIAWGWAVRLWRQVLVAGGTREIKRKQRKGMLELNNVNEDYDVNDGGDDEDEFQIHVSYLLVMKLANILCQNKLQPECKRSLEPKDSLGASPEFQLQICYMFLHTLQSNILDD